MRNKDILEIIKRDKQFQDDILKIQGLYDTLDDLVKTSIGELQYDYINQKNTIGSLLNDSKRRYENWLESEIE